VTRRRSGKVIPLIFLFARSSKVDIVNEESLKIRVGSQFHILDPAA